MIACDCEVCTSDNPKDHRLRCSVLVSIGDENFVIDTGPDFRQQMLREKVTTLSGVLFTHEHKDHVAGMDDVRAFTFREERDMQVFCSERVLEALKREFSYVFGENTYPGIPKINVNLIDQSVFELPNGTSVQPIEVMHYMLPVLGFRIGDFTYLTDAKTISETEKQKLAGTKLLIVNALRREEHIAHFTLEEALAFIQEVKPDKAYLTHISHLFGKHEDIEKELPENVFVAYDGLTLEIN